MLLLSKIHCHVSILFEVFLISRIQFYFWKQNPWNIFGMNAGCLFKKWSCWPNFWCREHLTESFVEPTVTTNGSVQTWTYDWLWPGAMLQCDKCSSSCSSILLFYYCNCSVSWQNILNYVHLISSFKWD